MYSEMLSPLLCLDLCSLHCLCVDLKMIEAVFDLPPPPLSPPPPPPPPPPPD